MSSNRPSSSKPDPRIAKKEVMVTRHKSAQMKRQLRTKDRSMKHITDLLKSPSKEAQTATKTVPVKKKQTSPKAKQSLLKSVEKVQNLPQKTFKLSKVLRKEVMLVQDEEYYPNKLKRTLTVKKVVLKPSHSLKLVGEIAGSVKRKCAVPLRVSDRPSKPSPEPQQASPLPKLSMAEAMSIMEEHMTDEDMMEILTCPSPVWWEDPPDEDYVEDAVFTRSPAAAQGPPQPADSMEMDTDNTKRDTKPIILIPNLSAKSDKFLKKRSKLEDILGSIKDKSNNKDHSSEKDAFNEDLVVLCSNYRVNSYTNEMAGKACDLGARLSESDDEIVFHNSSMNEDELLKDLENMDIPIAILSSSNDVIVIDDDDDDDFLEKPANSSKEANVIQKNKINDDELTVIRDSGKEIGNEDINNTKTCSNEIEVPKNLPALQKCELHKEIASPRSFDSQSSKSSVVSSQEMDSISDTNVRFLLDDEVDDNNRNTSAADDKMAAKSNEVVNKNNHIELKDLAKEVSDDNVTVYKIIEEISDTSTKLLPYNELSNEKTNIDEEEIKNNPNIKLNDYYKKCKKVYHKRAKKEEKTDINKNDVTQNPVDTENYTTMFCDPCKPSFKRVSEEENVKYCLNCSSIFDSKDCAYCIKKSKHRIYMCVPCKIKFCCEKFYKMHVTYGCEQQTSCREEVGKLAHDNFDPNIRVINSVSM